MVLVEKHFISSAKVLSLWLKSSERDWIYCKKKTITDLRDFLAMKSFILCTQLLSLHILNPKITK